KRLRPVELGPFDYEREVHTRALWIAEGITSYYDDLLLHRAGLMTDKEYLDKLSKLIERVETNPGSLVESLSDSSFDAWIKFYRSDENSRNSRTDYYRKGAVVGFLLDAEIRRATLDRRSLDDVMRLAYERYSGERGFTTAEFRAVATEVAGRPLDDFFIQTVDTTEKLDYGPALEHYGLRFAEKAKKGGQPRGRTDQGDAQTAAGSPDKDDKDDEEPGYLGADVRSDGTIARVIRGTPAYAAGLNVSDEILAIDDYRVHGHNLDKALKRFRPGTEVTMTVARRGKLRELPLTLGEKPGETWKLELNSAALSRTSESRRRWLAGN
ncbi:MAG: PDZ domain-containing protein, partial [Myxococcota bacterium]